VREGGREGGREREEERGREREREQKELVFSVSGSYGGGVVN